MCDSSNLPTVVRIQHSDGSEDLEQFKAQIVEGLLSTFHKHVSDDNTVTTWQKTLPMRVLYEFGGFQLYEEITKSPTYYLFRNELALLETHSLDIVIRRMKSSQFDKQNQLESVPYLIDLGSGRIEKAMVLLQAAVKLVKMSHQQASDPIRYCAIDLQYNELQDRLASLKYAVEPFSLESIPISIKGVCGTYFDAMEFVSRSRGVTNGKSTSDCNYCYLWLGSSITNMSPEESIFFLSQLRNQIMRPRDHILVGVDICQNVGKVMKAYGQELECWKEYVRNGLSNAGRLLELDVGNVLATASHWEYVAKWDIKENRHLRFARSKARLAVNLPGYSQPINIDAGECICIGQSYKYRNGRLEQIFEDSGLVKVDSWTDASNETTLFLLKSPATA